MLSASWTHHSKVLQYYSLEMFWEKSITLKVKFVLVCKCECLFMLNPPFLSKRANEWWYPLAACKSRLFKWEHWVALTRSVCLFVCVCQLLSARCRQCRRWAQRLWGSNFYKLQVRWSTLHWTVKTLLVRFVRHCHRSWSSSDEDDDHHRRRRRLRRHHHLIGGTKKRHVPVLWVPITSRPCALITSHPITSEGACSSIAQ